MITVAKLKEILAELPDDLPIAVMTDYDDSEFGQGRIYG